MNPPYLKNEQGVWRRIEELTDIGTNRILSRPLVRFGMQLATIPPRQRTIDFYLGEDGITMGHVNET